MKTGCHSTKNVKQLVASTAWSQELYVLPALCTFTVRDPNLRNGAAHRGQSHLTLTVKPYLQFSFLMCILSISSVLLKNPAYFSGDSQPRWLSWAQSCNAQLALRDSVAESSLLGTEGRKGPSFLVGNILPALLPVTTSSSQDKEEERGCLGDGEGLPCC